MRPLQEGPDIGQLSPFGMKSILPSICYNWKTTTIEDSKDQENLNASKNFQILCPTKATLMELDKLWKLSIPEIKVYRRKTGTWSIGTQSFVKKTRRQEISIYGIKAHGSNMGIDTADHGVIAAYAIVTVRS